MVYSPVYVFVQTSVNHMKLFTKKDNSVKRYVVRWLDYWFISTISFLLERAERGSHKEGQKCIL